MRSSLAQEHKLAREALRAIQKAEVAELKVKHAKERSDQKQRQQNAVRAERQRASQAKKPYVGHKQRRGRLSPPPKPRARRNEPYRGFKAR